MANTPTPEELLKGAQLDNAKPPLKLATLSLLFNPSDRKRDSGVGFLPTDSDQNSNQNSRENSPGTSSLLKEYLSRIDQHHPDHPGAAIGVVRIDREKSPDRAGESHFIASYGGEKQQQAVQQAINELPQNHDVNVVLVPLQSGELSNTPENRILSHVDKALKVNNRTDPEQVRGEVLLASKFPFTVDCAEAVQWFEKQWPNIQVVSAPSLKIGQFHEVADWDLTLPANNTELAPDLTKKQIAALFGLDEEKIQVKLAKETPQFSGTGRPAEDGNVYVKGITVQKRGGDITIIIKTTAKELGLTAIEKDQVVTNNAPGNKRGRN